MTGDFSFTPGGFIPVGSLDPYPIPGPSLSPFAGMLMPLPTASGPTTPSDDPSYPWPPSGLYPFAGMTEEDLKQYIETHTPSFLQRLQKANSWDGCVFWTHCADCAKLVELQPQYRFLDGEVYCTHCGSGKIGYHPKHCETCFFNLETRREPHFAEGWCLKREHKTYHVQTCKHYQEDPMKYIEWLKFLKEDIVRRRRG